MATTIPFLSDHNFDPADIEVLSTALDEAARRINVHDDPIDLRQALAREIVRAGQSGVRNHNMLASLALQSLGYDADGYRH